MKGGNNMPRKILIVYEKMGMGHLRMANILEDILADNDVEIIKYAGSELIGTSDVEVIVKMWNYLIKRNWIWIADIMINFLARILALPIAEVTETGKFLEKLNEINPDIVICTSDEFNKILGTYTKQRDIPFYIFITEVSIFIDLVHPRAKHFVYFDETGQAIRNYNFNWTYYSDEINIETKLWGKLKYIFGTYNDFVVHAYKNSIFRNPNKVLKENNNSNYIVIGPLAEKKHFIKVNKVEVKKKYNIPENADTVLIASGSIGGKFLLNMVNIICKGYNNPINILVMCGEDKITYEKLTNFDSNNELVNIIPFAYNPNFNEFLTAADVVIARPSAGIFIESLINKVPEITFRNATSNDKGTLTMIEKYKIGEVAENPKNLLKSLILVLNNKELYKANIDKLIGHIDYQDKRILLRKEILEKND
jgi:hypothetical protein